MFSVDVYFVIALLVICLGSKFVNYKKMLSAQSWKSFWFPPGLRKNLRQGKYWFYPVNQIWKHENVENSKEAEEPAVDTIRYDTRWRNNSWSIQPLCCCYRECVLYGILFHAFS